MVLMRYNKICFLICIVLFFISISCVSAGVDNETVDNLSSVSDDLEVSDEVYLEENQYRVVCLGDLNF